MKRADRLIDAAMRLVSGVGWSTHMLPEFTPQELRRAAVVVDGWLLAYPRVAAGCHSWQVNMGAYANSSTLLDARDGGRRYCQARSSKTMRDRPAAQRSRAEEGGWRERERRAERRSRP